MRETVASVLLCSPGVIVTTCRGIERGSSARSSHAPRAADTFASVTTSSDEGASSSRVAVSRAGLPSMSSTTYVRVPSGIASVSRGGDGEDPLGDLLGRAAFGGDHGVALAVGLAAKREEIAGALERRSREQVRAVGQRRTRATIVSAVAVSVTTVARSSALWRTRVMVTVPPPKPITRGEGSSSIGRTSSASRSRKRASPSRGEELADALPGLLGEHASVSTNGHPEARGDERADGALAGRHEAAQDERPGESEPRSTVDMGKVCCQKTR